VRAFRDLIQDGSEVVIHTSAPCWNAKQRGAGQQRRIGARASHRHPRDAIDISVGRNGEVRVRQQGSNTLTTIGQIELARFVNPEGLKQVGRIFVGDRRLARRSLASPRPTVGLHQPGNLKMSNVDPRD
jgi:flagellar basal body rod protein FlgG